MVRQCDILRSIKVLNYTQFLFFLTNTFKTEKNEKSIIKSRKSKCTFFYPEYLPSSAIKNQGKEPPLKSVAEGPMTNIMQ